jgi:glutaredoxin
MARSLVIAVVMTALVAGVGFVAAPKPRVAEAAARPVESDATVEIAAHESPEETAPNSSQALPVNGKRVFYQWTDERGSVRFARSLEEVPPAWRDEAGQVEVDASAFQPQPAQKRTPPAREPAFRSSAAQPERRRDWHEVTIYTAPWCGWCRKTLAFLDARGVEYVNKDIEADEEWAEELREKSGSGSVPFVEIDGEPVRGYNPGKMTALLQ